jgi:hypothetical protein
MTKPSKRTRLALAAAAVLAATVRTADAALQTVVAEIHDEKAPRGCHDPPTSGLTARHGR